MAGGSSIQIWRGMRARTRLISIDAAEDAQTMRSTEGGVSDGRRGPTADSVSSQSGRSKADHCAADTSSGRSMRVRSRTYGECSRKEGSDDETLLSASSSSVLMLMRSIQTNG